MRKIVILAALCAIAVPASAKDSLGVYSSWAAFRDVEIPRCYAIAKPRDDSDSGAYASIGSWPKRDIRNLVHFRLSRAVPASGRASVRIGSRRFALDTAGRDAWAIDPTTEAAIIAALRSATTMRVSGRGFTDNYDLAGVATAMDAATLGCAQR